MAFFFFNQKTAYEMRISDWSSDVCSSDLVVAVEAPGELPAVHIWAEQSRPVGHGAELAVHPRVGEAHVEVGSERGLGEPSAHGSREGLPQRGCQADHRGARFEDRLQPDPHGTPPAPGPTGGPDPRPG